MFPTSENDPASVPDSDSTFVPNASSVIAMSATFTSPPFSAVDVTVFDNTTAVGASFTSLIVSVKLVLASEVLPTEVSSTFTVTEYDA